MKMGELLKRIFSRKKQALLESSKQKQEKSEFIKELKFDTSHTENFGVTVLEMLGIREEFLKNTKIMSELKNHINIVVSQSNIENWRGIESSYTREEIENIRHMIESSVISDEEKMILEEDKKFIPQYGIKIDSETGVITCQTLKKYEEENQIEEDNYFWKDNGEVVVNYESYRVSQEDEDIVKNTDAIYRDTYDEKGVQMKSDHIDYDICTIQEHQEIIQRETPPYIAKREIRGNGTWQTSYHIINLDNLSELSANNFQDKNFFDTKEEAISFYEKNKRRFGSILVQAREW